MMVLHLGWPGRGVKSRRRSLSRQPLSPRPSPVAVQPCGPRGDCDGKVATRFVSSLAASLPGVGPAEQPHCLLCPWLERWLAQVTAAKPPWVGFQLLTQNRWRFGGDSCLVSEYCRFIPREIYRWLDSKADLLSPWTIGPRCLAQIVAGWALSATQLPPNCWWYDNPNSYRYTPKSFEVFF